MGGGFGAKIGTYSEEQLPGRIAKELGRPVVWRETRSESMVALGHGRAQVQHITLGGTRDGKVLAYRLRAFQDCGALRGDRHGARDLHDAAHVLGRLRHPQDRVPHHVRGHEHHAHCRLPRCGPARGQAAVERAMDLFAAEIGMDPVDVRRKNLIPKFGEPHTTTIGQTYDVGDYETALDKAEAAGYDLRLQAVRRASGDPKQLGIGVSVYVDHRRRSRCTRTPIELEDGGHRARARPPHGQGHVTAVDDRAVRHGHPDGPDRRGLGRHRPRGRRARTMGSRSLQQGGTAVHVTAEALVESARQIAAGLLEADAADVVLDTDRGALHVAGTPAVTRTWADIAAAAAAEGGLSAAETFTAGDPPSRSAATSPSSRSTPRPASATCAQVACDDAGRAQPAAPRRPDPRRHRAGSAHRR